jgi:hypothetical protein
VFDRAARQFRSDRTVALGARAFMPVFVDARTIVVPLQGPDGIARLDLETGEVKARIAGGDTCRAPHVARVARDGRLYVVCEGDHVAPGAVVQLDPTTLATVKRWSVGVYPDALGFGDD